MSQVKHHLNFRLAACALSAAVVLPTATIAQIKPETSGKPSFYEPEMRPHGSGQYRPNAPGQPVVGHTRARGGRPRLIERQ